MNSKQIKSLIGETLYTYIKLCEQKLTEYRLTYISRHIFNIRKLHITHSVPKNILDITECYRSFMCSITELKIIIKHKLVIFVKGRDRKIEHEMLHLHIMISTDYKESQPILILQKKPQTLMCDCDVWLFIARLLHYNTHTFTHHYTICI